MALPILVGLIAVGFVVLVALWVILAYNGLIGLKLQGENAFKQIDVQLKRRHDLIPNLVGAVKGVMKFEQETLEKVMAARNKAVSAGTMGDRARSESELTGVLGRLFAVVENYPQLKSNEQVRTLMEELSHTENTLGFSRQLYNDVATRYNTKIQVFPSNVVAGFFHFAAQELFQITDETERETPKVDLSLS